MSKGNPMCIRYNSYKVEFALRGAGHIHGVLWVDWDAFCQLDKKLGDAVKDALIKIKKDETVSEDERQSISDFADKFISCSLKNIDVKKIVEEVQIHHHTKSCRKYGPKCRFHCPRFPSLRTLVAGPIDKLDIKEDWDE